MNSKLTEYSHYMTYGNNRASGITRFLFLLFFTQLIMRYFLANCAPKIPNYANCAIFLKRNLCFNLLSLQSFFGFTFIQNYPVFCRQIHRSRALFSFPSCDWLYLFSNHGACYIKTKNKKDQSTVPNGQQHSYSGMPR